jgi:hypothetical protein
MAITIIVSILLLATTWELIGISIAFVLSMIVEAAFLVLSYHLLVKKSI